MTSTQRTRRLSAVTVATLAAVVLVAGCGGSAVQDAASAPGAATQTDTAAPDATAGEATATDTVAAGTATTDTAASGPVAPVAPGTENAADKTATGTTKTATDTTKRKASDTGATNTGGAGSAVQQAVATLPIFGGSGTCKPATLSEVAIGNVSTYSGVLGELYAPARGTLNVFVASQNACGGLNGHKIKLYVEDDQGDPSTAVSKVQGLIAKKVLAFVANIEPLPIDAVVPVIKKAGIPIIGGDLLSDPWYTNPLLFPQGPSGQAVAYGYLDGALNYHKKKNVGDIWCIEVPRTCGGIDRAVKELAPMVGANFKADTQVSITAPSYVQQCLTFKNAGVEALALTLDAASMVRLARSCEQVGFFPKVMPYPLGVGNEKQFFGNKWLGDAYVPLNTFPWWVTETPAQKYWQASVKKYNPGMILGGSASLGWTAGALLVAAAAELSPTNPTTADLLRVLYSFKGQKFTQLGGLTPAPLTFNEGGNPKIPYCLFAGITNAQNNGWAKAYSSPRCTKIIAPSDPQAR